MTTPSREELEKQIRLHEGQSEWIRWSMRVDRLTELADMMEAWNEKKEVTATCKTAPVVLVGLRDMLKDASAKLERLAEFAPTPKGRKKK